MNHLGGCGWVLIEIVAKSPVEEAAVHPRIVKGNVEEEDGSILQVKGLSAAYPPHTARKLLFHYSGIRTVIRKYLCV